MNIATRLDQAMKEAKIPSQSALSRASNVPQPTITRILKGTGKRGPETNTLKALAAACNVSFEWLVDGKGPSARVTTDPDHNPVALRDSDDPILSIEVPFLEQSIIGGTPGFADDDEYYEARKFSIPRNFVEDNHLDPTLLFAMQAAGMSMYSTIKPRDIVVLYRGLREPVEGKIFGVNFRGRAVIKRLEFEHNQWYLVSDNKEPQYSKKPFEEDTRIVGQLVMHVGMYL